ncbi:MAG: hypothetical protein DRG11_06810 [Epsilonproteobacteria bacterium]|nr:MAG: hypothetical protein DRG11_06810 [Campylobacterota bacterium]
MRQIAKKTETDTKNRYIDIIQTKLSGFAEIHKIIIFGSFINTKDPNDIDIAVIGTRKIIF